MIWLVPILLIPGGLCQNFTLASVPPLPLCGSNAIFATIDDRKGPLSQYTLNINGDFPADSEINLKFDSEPYRVERTDSHTDDYDIYSLAIPKNSFRARFYKRSSSLRVQVLSPPDTDSSPNIQSITFDGEEYCKKPIKNVHQDSQLDIEAIDKSCGRRKVAHTELIIHGQPTKPGDWPWHVAIIRVENSFPSYICGGTLLSKTLVMTAAHCASIRINPVVPDSLSIELGKYNLVGGDIAPQTREVFQVIIHPGFDITLNNDIALLKLKSEAVFTDYVQPACLWHTDSNLPTGDLIGTVAGWGFNHQNRLSSTLQQVTIPIVSELDCLKSNPIFFHKRLNTNKFCAGFANGTSVCNGDSGGGLMIFVPDRPGNSGKESGAWYVRGIVSLAPSRTDINVCDPDEYTIFTDVVKYRVWLLEHLN